MIKRIYLYVPVLIIVFVLLSSVSCERSKVLQKEGVFTSPFKLNYNEFLEIGYQLSNRPDDVNLIEKKVDDKTSIIYQMDVELEKPLARFVEVVSSEIDTNSVKVFMDNHGVKIISSFEENRDKIFSFYVMNPATNYFYHCHVLQDSLLPHLTINYYYPVDPDL